MGEKEKQRRLPGWIRAHNNNPFWVTRFMQLHHHWLCLAVLAVLGAYRLVDQEGADAYIVMSYRDEGTGEYGTGPKDVKYVAFWAVAWTFLRWLSHVVVLKPVAGFFGLQAKGKDAGADAICDRQKFADQGWAAAYYAAAFGVGLYVQMTHEWGMSMAGLWHNYPPQLHSWLLKTYYLLQVKRARDGCVRCV